MRVYELTGNFYDDRTKTVVIFQVYCWAAVFAEIKFIYNSSHLYNMLELQCLIIPG